MSDPINAGGSDAHGYTRQILIEGDNYPIGLAAFIKPHTDVDGVFDAFDTDDQCMVTIDGSKVTVPDIG